MERRKKDDGRTGCGLCAATILKGKKKINENNEYGFIDCNDEIVAMNISGDLFTSDDWGKSWRLDNYFPHTGSYVYETVKVDQYFVLSNNYGIHRSNDAGKTWENIYKTEELVFLDLIVFGNTIYGGTAGWGERRGKSE